MSAQSMNRMSSTASEAFRPDSSGPRRSCAKASEKTSAALEHPNLITPEQRGELAVLLSAVKVVAVEVGIQVTANLFELTGGRSTARVFEIDRYFRDLPTQSLHDPVAQKRLQVGAYYLRGEYPLAVDWYS